MIDVETFRGIITKGLSEYLGCKVIRTNQNQKPPAYPYVSYTITTLASANKGTYGEYDDGIVRKQIEQTWSITAQSDKTGESMNLALKAREWFDYAGRIYFQANDVTVKAVTNITNRDNILTVDYEYKNGFDVVFYLFDELKNNIEQSGVIEKVTLNEKE